MRKISCFLHTGAGILAFCVLFSATVFPLRRVISPARDASSLPQEEEVVFVIDAGHGGEDGGAVGVNGVREKDLNLSLAQMLGTMLQAGGYRVIYTRQDDCLLYTPEQNIRGKRKMYDLRNRLAVAEGQAGACLISIHMNTFPDPQYSGLQVYYGQGAADSRHLANLLQATVRRDLQPGNRRVPKPGGSSIYLLHRATVPAVLVECGFLTNPEECEKLSQNDTQRQLSFSLFCAMMEYIEGKGEET